MSTTVLKQIACRSRDRIYHPNCNAKCLIEYLSDRPLPFQTDLIYFVIDTIFDSIESPSFCELYIIDGGMD